MKKEHEEMLKEIMGLEEKLDHLFLTRRARREFQLEVEELQRLAEIGRATEKLFNEYDGVKGFYKKTDEYIKFYVIEGLTEWIERKDE